MGTQESRDRVPRQLSQGCDAFLAPRSPRVQEMQFTSYPSTKLSLGGNKTHPPRGPPKHPPGHMLTHPLKPKTPGRHARLPKFLARPLPTPSRRRSIPAIYHPGNFIELLEEGGPCRLQHNSRRPLLSFLLPISALGSASAASPVTRRGRSSRITMQAGRLLHGPTSPSRPIAVPNPPTPSLHPGRPKPSQTSFGPSQGHRPARSSHSACGSSGAQAPLRTRHSPQSDRAMAGGEGSGSRARRHSSQASRRHRLYKATDPPDSGRAGSRWEAGQRRQLANQSRRSCLGAPAPPSDLHQSKGI